MDKIAKRELSVLLILVVVFFSLLFPALRFARRETRDGIRRDEIAAFKQVLEQYYNKHEVYPLEFDASPHEYVVVEQTVKGATVWYLRARLENQAMAAESFDAESGRNYYYRLINQDGYTFYDVCGGSATCALAEVRER